MRTARPLGIALSLAAPWLLGCERRTPAPPADTPAVRAPAPAETSAAPVVDNGWRPEAGRVLVLADSTPTADGRVVFPYHAESELADSTRFDLTAVRDLRLDLFARSGQVGTATVAGQAAPPAGADSAADGTGGGGGDACPRWPGVRIVPAGPAAGWTVALEQGRAAAMPLDSVEGWSRPDSARATAAVARLASALPNDTAAGFRGLPFAVRGLWRLRLDDGEAMVATVVRKLSREADPREEHILLVARRDSAARGGWRTVFSDRTAGGEEAVQTTEVLAAVALGPARTPAIVLSRDTDVGVVYAILEREADGAWRIRWESAYAGC